MGGERQDVAVASEELDPDGAPVLPQQQAWPGPGLYTLRAMIELELALDTDVTVDAAHALISDGVTAAFGHRWFEWLTEALTAEGRDPEDLAVLLTDDGLAERTLRRMHSRMGEDDEAPDPPSEEYGWYAYSPDDPKGARGGLRRALRRRKQTARHAPLTPPRRRVAGRRDR